MALTAMLPEGELRVAYCDMLDKLIAIRDGDAALLYLYILRHGGIADRKTAARTLGLSADRLERALFTINSMTVPVAEKEDKPDAPPKYTADELHRARKEDHKFAAVCNNAENIFGRPLTISQLSCLLTAYEYLGLDASAIIELLSYLKKEKGVLRLVDIRRETNLWADMGILSAQDAQTYLAHKENEKPLSEAIYKALGEDIELPSPKGQRVCRFALAHGFPPEAVTLAMQRTEKQKGHKSLDYILGILRRWDAQSVHTMSEITALEPEARASESASQAAGQVLSQPTDAQTLAAWEADWAARVRNHSRKTEE